MIKLTITEKGGEPRSLTFDKDEVSIGRVSGNDIVLPKGNISKRHSRLIIKDGTFELIDLKSTNGTYLNGRKIVDNATVGGSDRIQVGDFLITLEGEGDDSDGLRAGQSSAARALPVPPPPPPPARGGSGLSGLPALPDIGADDDVGDEGYGTKSRSGRVPIPPPPPPPRRSTAPTAPLGLEDDGVDIGGDMSPPSPADVASAGDELSAASGPALFEGPRNAAYDDASRPMSSDLIDSLAEAGVAEGEAASPDLSVDGGMTGPVSEPAPNAEAEPIDQLDALVADATVTQIIIGGPNSTLVERNGRLEPIDGGLGDPNAVAESLWRLANTALPPPPPDNPVVDVRLADGTRIAAIFPPAAVAGVCGSIRKPALPVHSLAELAATGGLSKEAQTVIEAGLAAQRNLLITGDPGSVSILLSAVAAAIPGGRRVVSLGAGAGQPGAGWTELAPVGDLAGLIRVATALRADHLLVGEILGVELLDLLLAATHGQEGIILGLSARSAGEAMARLEALAGQVPGAHSVAALANSTLDLVLHVTALTDGGLRVTEIAEVKMDASNRLTADPVMSWRSEGSRRGAVGKMQILGVSSRLAAAMAGGGGPLPSNLTRK
ncbi:MAG TPA: ATPase, T2SS/T4P/T4SS family [Polyangia bacterium]|jgi:pilus assembly protein CpaF|nr:ATPase, T2SS/T4P/T4SS family [Polyangia bacterium]